MTWVSFGSIGEAYVEADIDGSGLISSFKYFNPTTDDVYLEFSPNDGSAHYIARFDHGADPEITVAVPLVEQPTTVNRSVSMYTSAPPEQVSSVFKG